MIGHKEWLLNFNGSVKGKVKFANDNTIEVHGKGKVMIKRKDGESTFVTYLLYIPSMKNNLLSLGQLLEKGFHINMRQD